MLQIDPNTIQIALVIVTIALVIITWKKMNDSNDLTKRSVELTKFELESRMRPWVSMYDFGPDKITLQDGSIIDYDKWAHDRTLYTSKPVSVRIQIKIKNSGPLPANDFRHVSFMNESEITREEVAKKSFYDTIRTLLPNEETGLNIDIPWNIFEKEQKIQIWIGGKLEYSVNKNKKAESGLIGYLFNGGAMKRSIWMEESGNMESYMNGEINQDDVKFQKKLALQQIWSSGIITIGTTLFAIGATMWVATWSFFPIFTTENEKFVLGIINMFNILSPFFMVVGLISIVIGFVVPSIKLR